MSQEPHESSWTLGKIVSTYEWKQTGKGLVHLGKHNQASRITLKKRRKRGKGYPWESEEVYVCKEYDTANVHPSRIRGLVYVHREWQTLSSVNHDNIISFVDFAHSPRDGKAWLYTDYCSEGHLGLFEKYKQDDRRLSYHEGAQVFHQVAQAFLYLHHGVYKYEQKLKLAKLANHSDETDSDARHRDWKPIVHRDIKPENIYISVRQNGVIKIKLGDFGIAKPKIDDSTDTYVGSRKYHAPEHSREHPEATAETDIYALGLTMQDIIKLNENSSDEGRVHEPEKPLEACVDRLIKQCLAKQEYLRLSSAVIVDQLETHVPGPKLNRNMINYAGRRILDWDTEGSLTKQERLKAEVVEEIALFRRLRDAGSDPNSNEDGEDRLLDAAVAFLNAQIENIGNISQAKQSAPPAWKMAQVEELISILLESGCKAQVQPYDLGPYNYEALEQVSLRDRKKLLANALMPKMQPQLQNFLDEVMKWMIEDIDYHDCLALLSNQDALHTEVLDKESILRSMIASFRSQTQQTLVQTLEQDAVSRSADATSAADLNGQVSSIEAFNIKQSSGDQILSVGMNEELLDHNAMDAESRTTDSTDVNVAYQEGVLNDKEHSKSRASRKPSKRQYVPLILPSGYSSYNTQNRDLKSDMGSSLPFRYPPQRSEVNIADVYANGMGSTKTQLPERQSVGLPQQSYKRDSSPESIPAPNYSGKENATYSDPPSNAIDSISSVANQTVALHDAPLVQHKRDNDAGNVDETFNNFDADQPLGTRLGPMMAEINLNAKAEKSLKLRDLKKFASNFKLNRRVPDDLVPILAKDPKKQIEIMRKAEEAAEKSRVAR